MNQAFLICFLAACMISQSFAVHLSASTANYESLEELFGKWVSWKAKHGKRYISSEEESYRFGIWKEQKADIERDPGEDDYVRGLNMFSDLTHEEWKSMYLNPIPIIEVAEEDMMPDIEDHLVPASVDWQKQGKTSPVDNQGQCGSCWAFSAIDTYNAAVAIKNGSVGDYSKQQLVSCSSSFGNGGCGGGVTHWAYQYIMQQGICTTQEYPYTSGKSRDNGRCDSSKQSSCKGKNVPIKQSVRTTPNNANALAAAAAKVTVTVAVDADRWSDYQRGVFPASRCGTQINHAVTLVGYVNGKSWRISNSWGADWGESGHMRLAWGNTCGILKQNFYPVL